MLPRNTYVLATAQAFAVQDWAAWEIFWGDERNSRMAHDAWLARVALPERQIHRIPAELGAPAAANVFAETLREKPTFRFGAAGNGRGRAHGEPVPRLGSAAGALAIAVHNAPKAPAARVSLSLSAIRACVDQLVLVSGSGKAAALAAWRAGADLPITRAVRDDATLLLDEAAAR
jgi:6-phosphogluconolactonase